MLEIPGSIITIITRRRRERCKQLSPCHTREDISINTSLIIYLHLLMLQMLCRAALRMLLSHQLHIDLNLRLTMHISVILEVRILIKRRIKVMVREVIKERGWWSLLPYRWHTQSCYLTYSRTIQPPYPRYYDANAKCEYHGGEIGHLT